jgi:S1-C subfamily serine protease
VPSGRATDRTNQGHINNAGRLAVSESSVSYINRLAVLACLSLALSASFAGASEREDLSAAVVRIDVVAAPPYLAAPWQSPPPYSGSGSGVILPGRRILTAAHVVAGATMLEVSRADSERHYRARVEHVCHDCDLALLRVSEEEFFEGSKALEIGDLSRPQERIEIHGFPIGGDGLSISAGIVSRILVDEYFHSGRELLLVQVDAPINPGNSGGPALEGGRVVGIAAYGIDGQDGLGYVVPAPVIRHFLDDVEDGHFDGIPSLGIYTQPLRNPAFRRQMGLDESGGGVFVTAVESHGSARSVLRPGDVLLGVDGVPIGEDGQAALLPGIRVDARFLEQRHQVGHELAIEFARDGTLHQELVKLRSPRRAIPLGAYDGEPRYRIYAGLVFQPLTERYLDMWEDGPASHLDAIRHDPTQLSSRSTIQNESLAIRDEFVVLSGVLHNELTQGYQDFEDEIVHAVNGSTVTSLEHLSEELDSAQGEFVKITLRRGGVIVVSRKEARAKNAEILASYGVSGDRSGGLESLPASIR